MAKIQVNQVAEILKKNQLDPKILRQIVEEMNLITQAQDDEDDKFPPVKKQFVVVISDPDSTLPQGREYVCWVLQIPENESVATTKDRLYRGVYDFNASKKGRLLPVNTVGEAIENVPAKHFKEAELWVKTKTPVLLVKINNEIPRE